MAVENNNVEIIKILLSNKDININLKNSILVLLFDKVFFSYNLLIFEFIFMENAYATYKGSSN